ncbi:phage tail protein [Dokdonella soli]|uniref:Tail fiber protein n=1 Tax=Dokdonella soli TaxID=529810 RepID=A0ABP3TVI1_9GAMM
MSQPFIGEIRMFGGNFAPVGWAFCEGQVQAIDQNQSLFQLIGTAYGGDGQTTFALPDLRGRLPIHVGPGFALGQTGGAESVTLTTSQIPAHGHAPQASRGGTSSVNPAGNMLAAGGVTMYTNSLATPVAMPPTQSSGGSQPHTNMQPYLCVNYIISLFGIFPSQT